MNYIEEAEEPETLNCLHEGASPHAGHPSGSGPLGRAEAWRSPQKTATTMRSLLEWAYGAQKVHKGAGGGVGGIGYASVSQTGAVLDRLRLGCSVSGGGGGLSKAACDDDALTVHGWVCRLWAAERALLIRCAELGVAPDWSPCLPEYRCVPVPGRRGRPYKGIYDRSGNEIGCEIDYQGFAPARAADLVRHAREVYGRWYSALAVLRDAVAAVDDLRRWCVTGIGAEPMPWRG